jgi:hypothetical protein
MRAFSWICASGFVIVTSGDLNAFILVKYPTLVNFRLRATLIKLMSADAWCFTRMLDKVEDTVRVLRTFKFRKK